MVFKHHSSFATMEWPPYLDHCWDVLSFSVQDEVTAPYSVAFHPHGSHMYCGFHNCIRIFDVSRAGRQSETRSTFSELWYNHRHIWYTSVGNSIILYMLLDMVGVKAHVHSMACNFHTPKQIHCMYVCMHKHCVVQL